MNFTFMLRIILCHLSEWVFSNLSAISWRKQVYHQRDDDEVRCVLDQHAELDFIVLAHWNNSLWVDMTLHSDTLFRFRANQPLLFLLHAACLVEKQQKSSFIVFGLILPGLEPPTIYRTRGEHANHYAIDAVDSHWKIIGIKRFFSWVHACINGADALTSWINIRK